MANNKTITASPVELEVTAGYENPKDQAVVSDPDTAPNYQTWDFTDGYFIHKATGKVLEAPTDGGGKLQPGTILKLADKSGKSNQKWTYGAPGPEYKITSQQDSSLCIWVKDWFNAGQPVIIDTEKESEPTQRWFLIPA